MRRSLGLLATGALLGGLLFGVSSAAGAPGDVTGTAAAEGEQTAKQKNGLRLRRVTGGLGDALFVTGAPGERNTLYVVRQSGRIDKLRRGRKVSTFLNISGRISSGGERGLLGLAFHPKYARNGRFFVNYTDRAGNTRVAEFRRRNANKARTKARGLLRINQPFSNHNGGHLAFGPDGFLYISVGDGGGGGDPRAAGQDVNSLLGTILRIDVNERTGGRAYGIPKGNPFVGRPGRPEIYHYGLRNPWRFSFDRRRGDMWIGDVGQNAIEEISFARRGQAGRNFGWNAFEGRSRFGDGDLRGPRGHTPPVAQYSHSDGCSVTGGYVSRGTGVRALDGRYVFADFCSGNVWSMRAGPKPRGLRMETNRLGVDLRNVTSFGQGNDGTVYVIASGALYRFARG